MEGLAEDRRKSAHQDLGHRLDKTTTSADVGASSRERPLDSPVHGGEAHRPSFAIGGGGLHKRSREGTAIGGLRVPFWA